MECRVRQWSVTGYLPLPIEPGLLREVLDQLRWGGLTRLWAAGGLGTALVG